MSEDKDKQIHALRVIDYVEGVLESFKSKIIAHGEDDLLTSSFVLEKEGYGEKLTKAMEWMNNYAHNKAARMFDELISFLDYHDTWPKAMFWSHFNNKLVTLGKTSVEFRKDCLFRSLEANDCTLFHEVCKLQPPAKVVKKMIEIIPKQGKSGLSSISRQYNHMSRAHSGGGSCRYPIHMVCEHGGSMELVKLLVSADEERDTLSFSRGEENSVYHVLVANKANHKPKTFSEILRYLVLAYKRRHWSPIMDCNSTDLKPVALLWKTLKESGLSEEQILEDKDFTFLLKATCYYHWSRYSSSKIEDIDALKKIEELTLGHAFLACSPCFEKKVVSKVLEILISIDNSFLFKHASHTNKNEYPIHQLVARGSAYCMDGNINFSQFLVDTILRLVPKCAQQENLQGLLPLHLAADFQGPYIRAHERLSLVRTIWQAYPEAANVIDKKHLLPPFALPARGEREKDRCRYDSYFPEEDPEYSGTSTTFFLLRQQPEMLSVAIAQCSNADLKETERPTKRSRITAPSTV